MIRYKGTAWLVEGDLADDTIDFKQVTIQHEQEFILLERQEADAQSGSPFPVIMVERGDRQYIIPDADYCQHADICPVCRSPKCNKMCIPDFARYN